MDLELLHPIHSSIPCLHKDLPGARVGVVPRAQPSTSEVAESSAHGEETSETSKPPKKLVFLVAGDIDGDLLECSLMKDIPTIWHYALSLSIYLSISLSLSAHPQLSWAPDMAPT